MTTIQTGSTVHRGDIILVLFPNSDLTTAKKRPALVVQADNLQTGLSQIVVAMITSRLFRANHPSRVLITVATDNGQQSGLLTDSVIMTDNLATILLSSIDKVIGQIPTESINQALRHTLGI
ncbi:MAG: type II toxin-antitoxin system PemK/MazF family toxin [Caldilineaceae bacterium]|nr:type II toxin-antitoxin system PemK/MazF family toxin [Caldilineaceae bacterium]MBP8106050.1 type II toxin-antitoxin system PemK/MazF family toxin [Caldilineaceae bacterium]MBP8121944.1 type II toxin-antitoxin system PemK/MazF family toxin [Caldilineaceae bacterium]MBP9073374.1 type II toxin-antitoxin system PemK/MazF family toxin [Caldilineaceae bacterium]